MLAFLNSLLSLSWVNDLLAALRLVLGNRLDLSKVLDLVKVVEGDVLAVEAGKEIEAKVGEISVNGVKYALKVGIVKE